MSKRKKNVPERDFPEGFLFGATCSMQETGYSDASLGGLPGKDMHQNLALKKMSTNLDFYGKIASDFDRAGKFGLNSMQISLPWGGVQTGKNCFDQAVLDQLNSSIGCLTACGIEPLLVLGTACTQPTWFTESGGWGHRESMGPFINYVEKIIDTLGAHCRFWIPVLEPDWWVLGLDGQHTQGKLAPIPNLEQARENICSASAQCGVLIRKYNPENKVGMSVRGAICKPQDKRSAWDLRAARGLSKKLSACTLRGKKSAYDFFALSLGNVFDVKFDLKNFRHGFSRVSFRFDVLRSDADVIAAVTLLEEIMEDHRTVNLPVYITGCGFPCENDAIRKRFIEESLGAVAHAKASGMDIRGYFFRSLLDHFSPGEAVNFRDGLVHVDFSSGARTPNPSAFFLGDIAQRGMLPVAVRKRLGLDRTTAESTP
jgi:beta-glucosidase